MRAQIERRLAELMQEYEAGARLLGELEARQASIRATLTRIGGAIQVLEEELAKADNLGHGAIGAADGSLGAADRSRASARG
jgi:hypothetical protein